MELPPRWEELEEWLRFPGREDDVEAFVWDLAERWNALVQPPPHAGYRAPRVSLPLLLDALVAHYALAASVSDEARLALESHLFKLDLDYAE